MLYSERRPAHPRDDEIFVIAKRVADAAAADVYFYNGVISRVNDARFYRMIDVSKSQRNAILFLITSGGDPDAAYKMARHLQRSFDRYTVVLPGICKSAGTLIAVGSHELAFLPYGELGPLDIQTIKTDDLAERQSGLTIQESLNELTSAAIGKHGSVFSAIIRDTGAIVSFQTAAKASSDLVTGLFAPIFARIDPYDVGEKARAMRIATDYGKRLSAETRNLKPNTLETLTRTYPSHSFVIDMTEAKGLFDAVREASEDEFRLAGALGVIAEREFDSQREPVMICLSTNPEKVDEDVEVTQAEPSRSAGQVAQSARRAKQATRLPVDRNGA